MLPVRRDLRFSIKRERVLDWHPAGRQVSHFMNSLSVMFPVGERFFIHSVRNYKDEISDPDLQAAVRAFIGQEAMHGREHEEYNHALDDAGIPAAQMERETLALLEWFKRNSPRAFQLSGTTALEHFTAILANQLLKDERVAGGSVDPAMSAMWKWHALEETEHKAVAFDVFRAVVGSDARAEAIRIAGLLIATPVLFAMLGRFYLMALRADPMTGRFGSVRGWKALYDQVLGSKPGVFRRAAKDWLDYFKPGFHPWDHDNRHFLEQMQALVDEAEGFAKAA